MPLTALASNPLFPQHGIALPYDDESHVRSDFERDDLKDAI